MPREDAAYWRSLLHHATLMTGCFRQIKSLGLTAATTSWEFYGFRPTEIETIHFSKRGTGQGVWFRLRDGRVFDVFAWPDETDPSFYEVTMD
jgi:hypothetical protein